MNNKVIRILKIIFGIVIGCILFLIFGFFHTHWLVINVDFDENNIVVKGNTYVFEDGNYFIYINILHSNINEMEVRFDEYIPCYDEYFQFYKYRTESYINYYNRSGFNKCKNIWSGATISATLKHNLKLTNSIGETTIFRRATKEDVEKYREIVKIMDDYNKANNEYYETSYEQEFAVQDSVKEDDSSTDNINEKKEYKSNRKKEKSNTTDNNTKVETQDEEEKKPEIKENANPQIEYGYYTYTSNDPDVTYTLQITEDSSEGKDIIQVNYSFSGHNERCFEGYAEHDDTHMIVYCDYLSQPDFYIDITALPHHKLDVIASGYSIENGFEYQYNCTGRYFYDGK